MTERLDREWPWIGLALGVLLLGHFVLAGPIEPPAKDALRYADYALNIVEHNTFGLTSSDTGGGVRPGNANAPLYPILIAAVMQLDDSLVDSLTCAQNSVGRGLCPEHYTTLISVQYGVAWFSLMLLWAFARLLLGRRELALGVVVFALISGAHLIYARRILTEILVIPGFLLLQLALLLYWRQRRKRWAVMTGFALALLTLTRPEYLYLALAIGLVSAALVVRARSSFAVASWVLGVLVCLSLLLPWAWRNHQHFDRWVLTDGGYGETILAYRLSYNRMTLSEWGASFVYWLPDFGDKLAVGVLPEHSYRRFVSDNADAFTNTAVSDILQPALQGMPREEITAYWLRSEIFGNALQHGLVSVALTWRGLFVRKYWGLLGFVAYIGLLAASLRGGRYELAVLSLPVWFMVAFYAGVSVSVPRYNLPLVSLYAMGLGWYARKLVSRWRRPRCRALESR